MIRTLLIGALVFAGCESERQLPAGDGVHPPGWGVAGDPAFHGPVMVADGYPFDECRSCHGGDLAGGDVQIGCGDTAGCHTDGVDDCAGTCHGTDDGPLPTSGRHATHIQLLPCESCHPVPGGFGDGFEGPDHLDSDVDVVLASWNPGERRCVDACHFDEPSPGWDSIDTELGCDGCHQQSPTHDPFADVVRRETCGDCHGGSPDTGHIDFELTVEIERCDTCHGAGPFGAPADSGHRRHLDSLLPGRIGKVTACRRCHSIPSEVLVAGHIDSGPPADVDLVLGDYDPATQRCVVSCHFDDSPGPEWTDTSGAELACDACHGFPPEKSRIGTSHPPSAPQLQACTTCHPFAVATHVDGEVNFR